MNKRLRQFEKESKLEIFGLGARRVPWEAALEKFAELIVRECADIAQQHNKSPVAAPLAIGYVIREHFGVQE
jgi:hypothetical protein